jgi:hypothetical protein
MWFLLAASSFINLPSVCVPPLSSGLLCLSASALISCLSGSPTLLLLDQAISNLLFKKSYIPVLSNQSKTMSGPSLRWTLGIGGFPTFIFWASEEGQAFTNRKLVVGIEMSILKSCQLLAFCCYRNQQLKIYGHIFIQCKGRSFQHQS